MRPMDFLGSVIVVLGAVALVVSVRLLFNRSIRKASSKSFPYHRQLLTFAIVLLGLFLAIGLLPIEHEVKGQILSLLGVLISAIIALSSTTLVGNAMAGIMLRLMHEFRAGDFIEGLLDHAVKYRVYGLLEEFSERLSKTSELHRAVLDALHAKGIEIASPSVMDRREYPSDHAYIPKRRMQERVSENQAAIEELAFDKAVEAESIEQLHQAETKLVQSLESLDEKTTDKKAAKQQREKIEGKIKQIQGELEIRKEEQAEKKESGE